MPLIKPCSRYGCTGKTERGGLCDRCKSSQGKTVRGPRQTSHQRGYDHKWRAAMVHFLAGNPVCVICAKEGRVTPSVVGDHIIPHRGNRDLFWDRSNWQALCLSCHGKKSASERDFANDQ